MPAHMKLTFSQDIIYFFLPDRYYIIFFAPQVSRRPYLAWRGLHAASRRTFSGFYKLLGPQGMRGMFAGSAHRQTTGAPCKRPETAPPTPGRDFSMPQVQKNRAI